MPSYAHAVGAVYRNADPSDVVVTAAGGLVGEVVQIWKPKQINTFETEWGFSCMGYEISGALGMKMAKPDNDIVVFIGDGSYLLQNSDIYSSVIYDKKLRFFGRRSKECTTSILVFSEANDGKYVTLPNSSDTRLNHI